MKKVIIALVLIIPLTVIAFLLIKNTQTPGKFDLLAKCLSETGVKMYGAWWCPHCKNQKDMFGKSFRYINYVECAEPGTRQGQTRECQDAGVESYPTWVFPDGRVVRGEIKPEKISEITNCPVQ